MDKIATIQDNKYYLKMKSIIEYTMSAFDDGKLSVSEVWAFGLILGDAVSTVINDSIKWDEGDTAAVKAAAVELYKQFVEPLDLPGPDYMVDPLLRDVVIPGIVEGAVRLAKGKEVLIQKQSAEAMGSVGASDWPSQPVSKFK